MAICEWVSPNPAGGYRDNPPANDGKKVILTDTDHLWGIGGNQAWVWKSLTRGLNPIFMDPYDGVVLGNRFDPKFESLRRSMGYALRLAGRLDLTKCKPMNDLSTTRYCLAKPGSQYLIYQPAAGKSLKLKLRKGNYRAEWFNPNTGKTVSKKKISVTEEEKEFTNPVDGDAVLFVFRSR